MQTDDSFEFIEPEEARDLVVHKCEKKMCVERESADSVDEKCQMAPLYLFLASSLNVELVYIILTSVNKFAHLKRDIMTGDMIVETENDEESQYKTQVVNLGINEQDPTLLIREIKIKDPASWAQNAKVEDLIQNKMILNRKMF